MALSACTVKHTANVARDNSEIVIKLMVAVIKNADGRLRYGARVQRQMIDWYRLIVRSVIEEDRRALGQASAEVGARLELVARPTAAADEWRRDERHGAEVHLQTLLGKNVKQDGPAYGVADENRAIFE